MDCAVARLGSEPVALSSETAVFSEHATVATYDPEQRDPDGGAEDEHQQGQQSVHVHAFEGATPKVPLNGNDRGAVPIFQQAAKQRMTFPMTITSHLDPDRRAHVERRLRQNLMVWLTTVRPNGQPDCVPVWFLVREDETILIYTQPDTVKLRNIKVNPKVALGLDVTDLGRDIIRIEGTAQEVPGHPVATAVPAFIAKYAERLGALFRSPEEFAAVFSIAVIVTPTKLRSSVPSSGVTTDS